VRVLFNTHWRPAHTGANELMGEAGARIIAHENTRLWMSTEYYVDWEKTNHRPRPVTAQPNDTFRSSDPQPRTLEHGGHHIVYGHMAEAYTDGDIYVLFPDENVIVAGEVLGAGAYPVPDYSTGGWIGGLQDATELLIGITDAETQVIAAHGPPQTRADLEVQHEMLETVAERIRLGIIAGKSVEEIVADDVGSGYEPWGDPGTFVYNVYHGLWWGGRLRGAY
jgi:cyclase